MSRDRKTSIETKETHALSCLLAQTQRPDAQDTALALVLPEEPMEAPPAVAVPEVKAPEVETVEVKAPETEKTEKVAERAPALESKPATEKPQPQLAIPTIFGLPTPK